MIDRALVVAGPIADVEAFEAMASERPARAGRLLKSGAVVPDRWRAKPALPSLRPLLRLLEQSPRRELRAALPRITGSRLESRTATIDGKLRLEYWFGTTGGMVG